jgi:hypothetical protein
MIEILERHEAGFRSLWMDGRYYGRVGVAVAAEIERLQRRSDALEIAEKALRDIVLLPSLPEEWSEAEKGLVVAYVQGNDPWTRADEALTAIAATSHEAEQAAPQGEVRE